MSLKNSIANCRKPFAWGYYRQAFYSPRYDVVVKKVYNNEFGDGYRQALIEESIFNSLSENEKKYFPVVGFERDSQGAPIVIMKKVDSTLSKLIWGSYYARCTSKLLDSSLEKLLPNEMERELDLLKTIFKLEFNIADIVSLVAKYNLRDLHANNIGVLDNRLVFIDFGGQYFY